MIVRMKRVIINIVLMLLLIPMGAFGQTYGELWKQVEDAQAKDLPQTAMAVLKKIESKAGKEKSYGQLLKATLLTAKLQAEIAPDSMQIAVERIENGEWRIENGGGDIALQAVYATVLAKIYQQNHQLADDWEQRVTKYKERAKAHPEVLAAVKADEYEPFVVKGDDSNCYGHDLLSVIGGELGEWQWLTDYYTKAGNRPAACMTALNELRIENGEWRIERLDSLIALYGDLPEACEIAMARYERMGDDKYTPAEKAAWLQTALGKWGSWRRSNMLKNAWLALINSQYHVQATEQVREVGKPQTVKLTELRHLQRVTMKVYRTTLTGETNLNPYSDKDYQKIKSGAQELKDAERTLTFTGHEDYDVFEDSLEIAALPAGVYLLEFASTPQTETSRMLYFVSGVRLLSQPQPDNITRYVVVDATTGQPLKGASLRMTFRGMRKEESGKWNEVQTLTTNANGEVTFDSSTQRPSELFAYTATDNFCPRQNAFGRYVYYEQKYNREYCNVFTDRSIYRPGQTVHVACIVWKEQSVTDHAAVEGKSVRMELRDTNYKLVAEQQATTDRYGKCSAQFTLPTGLLNGRFSIRAGGNMASFRVEEYKRPSFQVEFPEYKEAYSQGDIVHAQAKAVSYAGVPIQGAKVKYTVRRQIAWWWLNYSWYWQRGWMGERMNSETLKEGETVTADDGTFMVDIPMLLPKTHAATPMYYHFVVEADVTDMAGETHRGTMRLPLGSKPTTLTCDLPQQVRSDQMPKVTFTRRNAAGKEIDGTVKYRIDNGKWQQAAANCQLSIINSPLKSGEHRLEATCGDDEIKTTFVVFGLGDTRPATQTDDWFFVSDKQFPNDGKPVTVQVGSSDPNLHIVYSIFAGNKMLESGAVKKNAELVNRKFTYKEEYGNGLLLTFAWVKNGKCYMHQQSITRPMPDKKLKMTWTTFRDRLTPGQQEEWRLHVATPEGKPAAASLMAVLYDKSLDQISPHQWTFAPTSFLPMPSTGWQWNSWGQIRGSGTYRYVRLAVPDFKYSHFDSDVFPHYLAMMRVQGMGRMYKSRAATAVPMVYEEMAVADAAPMMNLASQKAVVVEEKATADDAKADTAEETTDVAVRENLNETAFCYPAVETDQEGNIVLKFTLPESLTTWRMMGVANTTDMLYGGIEGEAIAQKDVMIQPNMPRFIRMGDEAELSARIFNMLERPVSGIAKMQLIDPETEKTVYEQTADFSAEASKSTSVSFKLTSHLLPLTSDLSPLASHLLICRVTAAGDGFSDGEQHYLPILPDREMVTKTIAYSQHEPGVKTIDLTKLFPLTSDSSPLTSKKLTIEYTNSPAWLMVQSLPVLGQPWEHSAIDQAASYYSNLLARTLLQQNPQVKTVFQQWKHEEQSSDLSPLTSHLSQNQELKDIVLSETPWVWAADREMEQKQRLSDFFDENGIDNRLATAVEKLKKLQNSDGSFSWYPGMEGSTSMTVAVAEMLARLNVMAGQQQDVKPLYDKAFHFIGKETVKQVAEMKKWAKKGQKPTFPSFTTLRWLYICALDGRSLPQDVKSANDYLLPLLKKDIKNQTIYEKALTAIVLSQRGEQKTAANYVKSLKEYTVFTEEMGRYYDSPRASYSWYNYKIPTEVAALEAIQRVTPQDQQTVDEMRRWLLQEKRTQMWDTPISTVNAIYAFLFGHQDLLASKEQTALAIDGSPVDIPQATAGIGYVKTAINNPQGKTFTATKSSEGTSWGAVYAQFMQKTHEVEASQSGISVKREVIVRNNTAAANYSLFTLPSTLTVGDRIKVRITIETQRDLDFVQVSDRRAACMEPVNQLSGYHHGAYCSPKDNATNYFFYGLAKGKHVIETEYYIDRAGTYESGTCTVGCAYAPEYRATAPSMTLKVKE